MRQLITSPGQVGEIIRSRRKARRIAQQTLATQLQLSQSRLSTLESAPGDLTLSRLITLANLLGLEISIQDKAEGTSPQTDW